MRKVSILVSLLSLIFGATLLRGQEKPESIVVRLDPALDRIVAPDVEVETLLSKEGTFEGPDVGARRQIRIFDLQRYSGWSHE